MEHAGVIVVKLVVLCRHYDGVDTLRDAFLRIFHSHLALRVRTEIGHFLAFLADVGECAHDELCEVECYGHVVLGLVGGVTEHHSLVAGTLVFLLLLSNAAVDIFRLLVNGSKDAA